MSSEPVKYLTLVTELLELYQSQLLTNFKKMQSKDLKLFAKKLNDLLAKMRRVEDEKGIHSDRVSEICQPMSDYLLMSSRPNKTSHSQRYAIRASLMTQEGNRMRFTGGLNKIAPAEQTHNNNTIEQSQGELQDIIHSYKIQDELAPRMRMKWKSFQHDEDKKYDKNPIRRQRMTIGDNNIDLLSYTIPEIENSIKRLSLQSRDMRQRSPDRSIQAHRTIDTRMNHRKKYVPRFI